MSRTRQHKVRLEFKVMWVVITANAWNIKTSGQNRTARKARIKGNNLPWWASNKCPTWEPLVPYWASYLNLRKYLHVTDLCRRYSFIICSSAFLPVKSMSLAKGQGRQRNFWWHCGRQKKGSPQNNYILMPWTCDCVTLQGKGALHLWFS